MKIFKKISKNNRPVYLLLFTIIVVTLLSGCAVEEKKKTITIAEQYGLAYAPVQIMKDKKLLEENTDNVEITWKKMANTAAIRESMLAGKVDIGFVALPPFLIGKDKGMEWKIISGLSMSPLGLMTYKEDVETLADIGPEDRIALPQPGSIQHILLAMAAEREFTQPDRFDEQLVTMAHPDGMNALLSRREITAHFTSPPYIFMESKEEGIHQVLSGREALGGEFSFIVGIGLEEFHNKNPETYKAFVRSLQEAVEFINYNPDEAAELLAKNYDLSAEEIKEYITWPGMKYTLNIKGLDKFISFMRRSGYIDFEWVNKNRKEEGLSQSELSKILWEVDFYEKQ